MATVRQQTVVQTSSTGGSVGQQLDNSLDALLEDLQTSVARSPPGAMNGLATHEYREVRRTVRQETNTVPQELQVQYLTAANPTTVVAERSASPLIPSDGQRTVAYKTMTYQYNTSGSQSGVSNVLDTTTSTTKSTDSTSDTRLRKDLNELDNLLVDLHQAQKGSYSSPSGGSARSTMNRVEVSSTRGIDSGLLEPVDMSTPLPPARQPHVSRSTQFQQQQQQQFFSSSSSTGGGGGRSASVDSVPSPRLQPRRSTSAQRELVFDGPGGGQGGGAYYRDKSPSNQRLQREMFYSETKSSTSPRYRELSPEKSPSSQRVYYETKPTGGQSAPWPGRYRDPSPGRYRDPSPDQGSASRVTTVRSYNYSTQGGGTPLREPSPEPGSRTTTVRSYNYTGGSPAPPHRETSPDPGSTRVTTVRTYNYSGSPAPPLREPSPDPGSRTTTVRTYNYSTTGGSPAPPRREPSPDPGSRTTTVRTYNYSPAPPRRDPFPEVPIPVSAPQVITYQTPSPQPGTKVTTTVRTYTYELPPGQQGYGGEPPSTYHVSPPPQQPPRDREPLVAVPQQPDQPPTVITYKYSSHSTHNSTNKYPGGAPRPEEQQPLLPRPFPTPSPTPAFPTDNQPPKRLDDLMASFSDTEPDSPPGKNYYMTEKHTTSSTSTTSPPAVPNTPQSNGVGVPPHSLKEEEVKKTDVKERAKTTNKAGPPVYYPPGVELFAKKEESMAMSASGKKASGRYEYEASKESKSKSSSSGGAAVVPVCLPVCCAMPCVIM